MKPIFIISPSFTKLVSFVVEVYAICLFPFIISKYPMGPTTRNHEMIHFQQQKELLVIFFYILYCFYYIKGYIIYRDKEEAYHSIPFEKEAYSNQGRLSYLETRNMFSWLDYR